jgi:hypothetical protein
MSGHVVLPRTICVCARWQVVNAWFKSCSRQFSAIETPSPLEQLNVLHCEDHASIARIGSGVLSEKLKASCGMERIKSRLFLDYCCFFYLLVWPSCTQGENKIKEMFEGTESVPFVALSCDCVFFRIPAVRSTYTIAGTSTYKNTNYLWRWLAGT